MLPTPLFLDVSGTKVRLNPVSSTRIMEFFSTVENGQIDSAVF